MDRRLGILEWSVAALMTMLVVIVFAQVLVRYLTYQPLDWTEEAARYIFIWLCLLGAVVATRRGQHFAVDLFQRSLPDAAKGFVASVICFVEAVFFLLLAWAGFRALLVVYPQRSPSLEISMSIPYLAIPLGATIMAIVSVRRAWSLLPHQRA